MTRVVSEPEVTLALIPSQALVGLSEQRVLVIGQKVPAGTATAGELVTNIQNDSAWDDLFGSNSQIAGMIRKFRELNTDTNLDAISLDDDGAGVAATGAFVFTGTATEDGVITVIAGSEEDYEFEVPVFDGDTAATIAVSASALIQGNTDCPVSSSANAGSVDLVADNDGTVGNSIPLKVKGSVAGVSVSITAMSGGSIDPSFTNLFDPVEDRRYQTIIWPYFDDVDTVKDFLDDRFNVVDNILDGVAHIGVSDTFANLQTLGNAHNSQSVVLDGDEDVSRDELEGSAITEIPYARASSIAAVDSLGLTEGSNYSRYVLGNGSKDRFGGAHISSLPYFNRPLPNLPLMEIQDGFTREEVKDLETAGVSTIGNNKTNTDVLFGEMVTTYKTDAASNPDGTWKFLNYVRTSSAIREFFFNNLKARFVQSRLTEGGIIPGYDMTNKAVIEAFVTSVYQELANIVLVQEGEAALQFFKDNLVVELDIATGTVFIEMVTPIVTQLRVILGTIRIEFTTEG